ncbi:MAG: Uma2 family endonuclease [Sarcina sp.]
MENRDLIQRRISEVDFDKLEQSTDEKIEYNNGQILYSSSTSQRHNDIISNIVAVLKHIVPNGCKVFHEAIEVRLEDKNKDELYKYKPDVFVICGDYEKKGETVNDIPKIIFEVVSPKYDTHDTITKRLVYEKFGVLEYNIIFQNGDIIQYFLNEENIYEMRLCHKGDKFKSNIYKELNILVDDLVEEGYSKKIEDNKALTIAKNLLDILDDETISEKTGLTVQDVKKLRE